VFLSHNVKIGSHVVINANSTIGHHAVVSNFSQVCPNVSIGGNGVIIGEGAYLGPNVAVVNK
jgi:acetyltransferase EpsM